MVYDAKALEIFIASPSDVVTERAAVREAIASWNATYSRKQKVVLMPVGWETHSSPELSGRPQQMVNDRLLPHADILVGIFWSRVGTPTGQAASGSIEEIERHMADGKPAMLYFSTRDIPQDMIDNDQLQKLTEFRNWASEKGLYDTYQTADDLRSKLRDHLPRAMSENKYVSSMLQSKDGEPTSQIAATAVPPRRVDGILEPDAQLLLKNGAVDGSVRVLRHLGGTEIAAGNANFTRNSDGRVIARWKAALGQLAERGLIEDPTGAGEFFTLTDAGYRASDALPDNLLVTD